MYIKTPRIILVTDGEQENDTIGYRKLVLEYKNKDMLKDLKNGVYVSVRYIPSMMLPLEINQVEESKEGDEAYVEDLNTKYIGNSVTIKFKILLMIVSLISVSISLILCMLIYLAIYILL